MAKDKVFGGCSVRLDVLGARFVAAVLLGTCPVLAGRADHEGKLLVRYADVNIKPALGVRMPGFFHERKAGSVLDPLLAKGFALSRGETTLAIVALDLIGVSDSVMREIREAVQRQAGIPPEHIFVHATHTHTGAAVSQIKDEFSDQVASAVKKSLDGQVVNKRTRLGTSGEKTVAFIRRYLMKDGTVRTNPGRGNPNIVHPIGEIDPVVYVISFDMAMTLLVSYGLHADCVGVMTETVRFPARKVPKDLHEWAKGQMQEDATKASKRRFNEFTPSSIMQLAKAEGTTMPAEIVLFRIGTVGIVGLPPEVFVEIAQDIKANSLLEPTLVIGLTGGSLGYMPHPRGYDEGGYETRFGSARYARETPVMWYDVAVRLIKELKK